MKAKRLVFVLAAAILVCAFPFSARAGVGGTAINSISVSSPEITAYTPGRVSDTTPGAVSIIAAVDPGAGLYECVFTHESDPSAKLYTEYLSAPMFQIDNSPFVLGLGGKVAGAYCTLLPGKYLLTSIRYGDGLGGMVIYGNDITDFPNVVSSGALPAEFAAVSVNLNLPVDTTPPVLTGIASGIYTIDSTTPLNGATVTPGLTISNTVTGTDDVSGFSGSVKVTYRLKGTDFTIDSDYIEASEWVNGEYEVSKVAIADAAGNIATYEGAALAAIPGADTTFTVAGCSKTILTTASTADDVIAEIAGTTGTAENPAVLSVNYADGDAVLDPAIFEALFANPNVLLRVALPNGLTWIFEGGVQAALPAPVDLNVQYGPPANYEAQIDTSGDWGYVLDFPANGALSVSTSLFIPAWSNAPAMASLYFVQPDGSLLLERTDIPLANGGFTVPFTHNSSFILTDRVPYPAPDPTPNPETPTPPPALPTTNTTPTSPQTGVYD